MNKKTYLPAILVLIAALLWSMDSVVRYPAALKIDPFVIVTLEHLIGLLAVLPWMIKRKDEFKKLRWKDLFPVLVLGIGGSALGGIFYTESVREIGPSSATLFQMIQPLFVVSLAHFFLKEKGSAKFFQCAIWAIINSVLIGFPGFNFGFDISNPDLVQRGILFGLLAVVMWGFSTIAGKWLLFRFSPIMVVFLRYVSAVVFMGFFLSVSGTGFPIKQVLEPQILLPSVFLGTVVGAGAMLVYYHGLKKLPASLVTFIELIYPVGGALIPVLFAGSFISPIQLIGVLSLGMALFFLLSFENQTGPELT